MVLNAKLDKIDARHLICDVLNESIEHAIFFYCSHSRAARFISLICMLSHSIQKDELCE